MNGVRIGVGREEKTYKTTPKVSRLSPGRTGGIYRDEEQVSREQGGKTMSSI